MSKAVAGKQGLTLIETLVVIAISVVLIAMLMSALQLAKAQGKKIVCQSQMRQLATAHTMYQQSHEGFVVPATQNRGLDDYWYNTLGPYFGRRLTEHGIDYKNDMGHRILRCPMDNAAYPKMLNPHGDDPEGWLSYALNSQPTRHAQTRQKWQYAGVGGHKITDIRRPSEAMLHCDFAFRAWVCDSVTLTRHLYGSEPGAHYDKMPGYPEQNQTIDLAYRHNGGMNLLWLDGHVSLFRDPMPSAEDRPEFWGGLYDQFSSTE
jgi:prepilin-type processing-associated H-X9-DG protein/prepilin-type N-terminal cleavage/methylation domain-containing protein